MPAVIAELKTEHRLMLDMLRRAVKLGVNSPAAATELAKAAHLVVSHLQKEDELIYPVLKRHSETDAAIKDALESMHPSNARALSDLREFLDHYQNGGLSIGHSGNIAFILMALEARIELEEREIYEMYLKTQANT